MMPEYTQPKMPTVSNVIAAEGGTPFGNHRTHRTRVALLLHKYIMFCGFWLCIGFAISEMVSDSNTVIKTDDFGHKVRQTAAIIPHEKQKNIKK